MNTPGKSSLDSRRGSLPANHRSVRQPCQTFRRDQPPGPRPNYSVRDRPNFVIELLCESRNFSKSDVHCLVSELNCRPDNYVAYGSQLNAGSLFFQQWPDVLDTIVQLWDTRLKGIHMLNYRLIQNLLVPSDKEELHDRLRKLFAEHVRGLREGVLVKEWEKDLVCLSNEIDKVTARLGNRNSLMLCDELLMKKGGLLAEKDLIIRRLKEFDSAMNCIQSHLEERNCDQEVKVFKFGREYNWVRIHFLIMRECKRLDNGLPIYAFRKDILLQIHQQQVTILIGETGSGKSTQLVQYLADAKITGSDSIICTQPRKLAAISISQRVREESHGCNQETPIVCYPTYSSSQQFDSKIIYATDNCLLQYYMNDKNLSKISCIIIDEAHERSLNTDLLLAALKNLLHKRTDLRLIIMSATANSNQLSEYFFGCNTFHVVGRTFPVDIKYIPCCLEGSSGSSVASYVSDVVRTVMEIHKTEKGGSVLAFLTSQMEVEWACEKFQALCEKFQVRNTISLPLHGKLSHEEQIRVFSNSGRRKVIFATNLAETSLTIPGVKYVVDCGMVKESRFDAGTGMNVLKVCRISQSSAGQRAGRAGRTEPGKCFRLYTEYDFEKMPCHSEPEIRKVHLGVAVLRILALGINNVQGFDFVDAPSAASINMAIRNLLYLKAVVQKDEVFELTRDGWYLVKLGIEPRLGKTILSCFNKRLGKEGLILAAVMANSSSIFCRVGTDEDKFKSDRLKLQFCHPDGELFSLLWVYKKWEEVTDDKKNNWCWENSINAKSMRRCKEMVQDLESCLLNELNIIIPSYWVWNPDIKTDNDKILKEIILSSFAENVAMYSGYDQLGYEIALTGKHVQLHPSCSLLNFSQRPNWIVFGEILSVSREYLVCVTSINVESLHNLSPQLFEVSKMESRKLEIRVLSGFGSTLLKRLCGKFNNGLTSLISRARTKFDEERIGVEVNIDRNELVIFACLQNIEKVTDFVKDALVHEKKWLQNECTEKCLYHGGRGLTPPIALFGSGAEIKHLELQNQNMAVDLSLLDPNVVDDKELLRFMEESVNGTICRVQKFTGTPQEGDEKEKWGRVTFLSPDSAKKAIEELNYKKFTGGLLKVTPSKNIYGADHKAFPFPAVRAKIYWPRRISKKLAIVKFLMEDLDLAMNDLLDSSAGGRLLLGGQHLKINLSSKSSDSIAIHGIPVELSEVEVFDVVREFTSYKIQDIHIVRGEAHKNPECGALEQAILKEISNFMPIHRSSMHGNYVQVQVFQPQDRDYFMKASVCFDGSLHLEAARALEQIEGKVLPGCLHWQKIKCERLFHSYVSCPLPVYNCIRDQLESLLRKLERREGVECKLDRNENGSYRVKIAANATKIVAELRRPLERLMKGQTIDHPGLTPTVFQLIFSKEGYNLMKSIQKETKTYILFDKHNFNIRIFGSPQNADTAQKKLLYSLTALHQSKQLEVHLRGGDLPPDLMKRVVSKFGPDLQGLKNEFPNAEFTLNTKHHLISVNGSMDLKEKVKEVIYDVALTAGGKRIVSESSCPICLCEIEDNYCLENCGHEFCRSCLLDQLDSALKSRDSFPILCTYKNCKSPVLLTDLRSLLSGEKLEELFRSSLGAYVSSSSGKLRFCPSPDCPSVYEVEDESEIPFVCGACFVETCKRCHVEYHASMTCEEYKEYKEDPDSSLKEWCKGKENVKSCPVCGFTIEKIEGCNHVECRCGRHICWVCLEVFNGSTDCYDHLRFVHLAII